MTATLKYTAVKVANSDYPVAATYGADSAVAFRSDRRLKYTDSIFTFKQSVEQGGYKSTYAVYAINNKGLLTWRRGEANVSLGLPSLLSVDGTVLQGSGFSPAVEVVPGQAYAVAYGSADRVTGTQAFGLIVCDVQAGIPPRVRTLPVLSAPGDRPLSFTRLASFYGTGVLWVRNADGAGVVEVHDRNGLLLETASSVTGHPGTPLPPLDDVITTSDHHVIAFDNANGTFYVISATPGLSVRGPYDAGVGPLREARQFMLTVEGKNAVLFVVSARAYAVTLYSDGNTGRVGFPSFTRRDADRYGYNGFQFVAATGGQYLVGKGSVDV